MIVAISNPKGGTGKSTSAVNLAALSARAGNRTLLIDLDTQQTCSLLSRAKGARDSESSAAMFQENPSLPSQLARPTPFGYDIVPATGALNQAEKWIDTQHYGELKLRSLLRRDTALASYDKIFFDTPGFRGSLVSSTLLAVDSVIVPLQASEITLDDFKDFIPYLDIASAHREEIGSPPLEILSVVFVDVDERTVAAKQNLDKMRAEIEGMADIPLAPIVIPHSTRIEEANNKHAPVVVKCGTSKVSVRYIELFKQLFDQLPEPIVKVDVL